MLPQACGIKVDCASVVFCGLPDHVKQPMTCFSFGIWEILLCNPFSSQERNVAGRGEYEDLKMLTVNVHSREWLMVKKIRGSLRQDRKECPTCSFD